MEKSESIIELSKAMAKFRAQLKQPLKDAENPFFKSKYVPLESVIACVDKAIEKTGLSYVQEVEDGKVKTIILHESGEYMIISGSNIKPIKPDPQAEGSAITYAKRYSLSAAFGIASDPDDDGNAGSVGNTRYQNHAPVKAQTAQKVQTVISVSDVETRITKAENLGVPAAYLDNWKRRVKDSPEDVNKMITDYLKSEEFKNLKGRKNE